MEVATHDFEGGDKVFIADYGQGEEHVEYSSDVDYEHPCGVGDIVLETTAASKCMVVIVVNVLVVAGQEGCYGE